MKNMLCSRCKKRMAVVFMNRIENGETISEGLCLKCAKELNIPGFSNIINSLNISEEDIDNMSDMLEDMNLDDMNLDEFFEEGGAKAMPLIQNIMGSMLGGKAKDDDDEDTDIVLRDDDKEEKNSDIAVSDKNKKSKAERREKKHAKYKYLDSFCTNLNEKVEENSIDPIVGRDKEIYRVIQILNRRIKNNPCLIGEPGVGKTAIAEGIAQKIVNKEVPQRLSDKVVYLLDLTALVAGTQFRGQFEGRVKGLVDDVKRAGNVILFIDEVHTLVGAGDNNEGSMNAANILKPALSRGEIQVIGATTFNEYRKNIEKDAALERRFQTVKVGEPTIDEATEIIIGIKKYYESFHRVSVSDAMARKAVELSERYINDRFLPDKAIDLLDEACSCSSLANKDLEKYDTLYAQKVSLDEEIEDIEGRNEVDYELLAQKKSESARLVAEIEELSKTALNAPVTEKDFAEVIELWTGIPASKIEATETEKLGDLENSLKKTIVGQDEAIRQVSNAVKRARIRLNSRKKKPASFIFVGPTGVGKTQLVKDLSEHLFDNVEPLIRLDMSEFMEKHTVSKIIGSPPGYVGYDEAGQLTEKVRRRPYSIVLLDEIEKAHPDVLNILLQIMDEGHIRDGQGRDVSFENVILIMTSNAGSEKRETAVGFNREPQQVEKEKAMDGLKQFLRPEFLARVDEIITFNQLTEENYADIAAIALDELKLSLKEHNILFDYSDEAKKKLAHIAFNNKNGARDIHRQIRIFVEDPICSLMTDSSKAVPSLVKAVVKNDKVELETA